MSWIFFLAFAALFGFIVRSMAIKRGRDEYLGFLFGFCFGIFAVLGYAIAGETEEKKVERIKRAMS